MNDNTQTSVSSSKSNAQSLLTEFASNENFLADIQTAFGSNSNELVLKQFSQQWQANNFDSFPEIEIRSSAEINGANGAFSVDTNKIYLSKEFVANNNSDALTSLILEEYGHFVDSQINASDAPGDEGDIFSRLVQGEDLTSNQLNYLRAESDHSTATIDGENIAIEANIDLDEIADGLDSFFDTLQRALSSQVFGSSLPLFGTTLKDASADSIQFINNLRTLTVDNLRELNEFTPNAIAKNLNQSLSGIGTVTPVETGDPTDCRFILSVGETGTDPIFLDSDLAFEGLGINEANDSGLGLNLSASADVTTGYTFDIEFGVDLEGGFYVDTSSPENEIIIDLDVTNLSGSGQLGALNVNVTDNKSGLENQVDENLENDNSSLVGTFNVNLTGDDDDKFRIDEFTSVGFANLIEGDFDIDTNVDIDLKTTVNSSTDLPSVGADLNIDWQNVSGELNPTQSLVDYAPSTNPTVGLDNAEVCLGSFFSNIARPTLENIQNITQPLQPIIDALTTSINLGVQKINLLDIAEQVTRNLPEDDPRRFGIEDRRSIEATAALISLINSIPTNNNDDICLDLGTLALVEDIRLPDFNPGIPDLTGIQPIDQIPVGSDEAQFFSELNSIPGQGVQFPILDDPNQVFNLLLGNYDDVTFFSYDAPTLEFTAEYSQFFPILGPLGAEIRGTFGALIDLEFGFDGSGINPEDNNRDILRGFFIYDDFENDGDDEPEVTFTASLEAFAAANVGFASAGVGGGIYANIDFNLNNLIDDVDDDRIIYGDLQATPDALDPTSDNFLFTTSGQLSAGLSAYIKVNLLFGSYTKRFNSPRKVILDFGGEQPTRPPQLVLATEIEDGVLRLNMGPNASDRIVPGQNEDINEVFVVTGSSRNNNTVTVSAFNERLRLEGISRIVADGGEEEDFINLGPRDPDFEDVLAQPFAVAIPAELSGGNGNDELIGGFGDDTLKGNAGWDRLNGGAGNDLLIGDSSEDGVVECQQGDEDCIEDDVLVGGFGADTLRGGVGFDIASYETSSEGINFNLTTGEATGHAEGDVFESIEQISGSAYDDTLIGSPGDDRFNGADGNDLIDGADGNDILIASNGDDTISGGAGSDLLVVDYSTLPTGAVVRAISQVGGAFGVEGNTVVNAYGLETPRQELLSFSSQNVFGTPRATVSAISADGSTVVSAGEGADAGNNNSGWTIYIEKIGSDEAPAVVFDSDRTFANTNGAVAISADGSRVAWVLPGDNIIYVANADGTDITSIDIDADYEQFIAATPEITEEQAANLSYSNIQDLSLSGDGNTVAWTINAQSPLITRPEHLAYIGVAKINEENVNITRSSYILTDFDAQVAFPSLSFDGAQIAWHQRATNRSDFNTVDVTTRVFTADTNFTSVERISPNPTRTSFEDYVTPSISADGSTIAYKLGGFNPGILVYRTDSGSEEIFDLPDGQNFSDSFNDPLILSSDGEEIFFALSEFDEEQRASRQTLNVINADGTGGLREIEAAPINAFYNFSPQSFPSEVSVGVRYGDFDLATGSGEIITWGPSRIEFDSIEQFDFTGTIYGDELFGGNDVDVLRGAGGADTLQGGQGDDIYELNPDTAAGSEILDTAGEDTLNLITIINIEEDIQPGLDVEFASPKEELVTPSLIQPTNNIIGITQQDTTLIIDINRDGIANPEDDISILNYFNEAGTAAGTGYIEMISDLNGADIINFLANGIEPPPTTGTTEQGTAISEELTGDNGNDTLIGAGGADTLEGGGGSDVYRLDVNTSGGSEIRDTVGIDSLELNNGNLSLVQPVANTIGLARDNTTLIIDLNQDGIIEPENDLSILNYFDESGTAAGNGFIENVANLSGDDILNLLASGNDVPEITVSDLSLDETNNQFVFTVTLAEASEESLSITYATEDGIALGGEDYTAVEGTLEFAPGETEKTVTVEIANDSQFETNETFSLNLISANGAVLNDIRGTGVITNNEVDVLIPTENDGLTASLSNTDDSYIYQNETYYYDFFALPVNTSIDTGDIVTVTLASENFDPILMILDAEGNVLEYNDNANEGSINSELTFIVGAEDSFFVSVETKGANQTGDYLLDVDTINVDVSNPENTPLTIIDSVQTVDSLTGNLSDTDIASSVEITGEDGSTETFNIFEDNYLLQGSQVGQEIRVSLSSDVFDGELNIFEIDPTGNIESILDEIDVVQGIGTTETADFTIEPGSNYLISVTGGTADVDAVKFGDYSLMTEVI